MSILAAGLAAVSTLTLDVRSAPQSCPAATSVIGAAACAPAERLYPLLAVTLSGTPATVLVDPGGSDDLEFNPAFIARAQIFGRGIIPLSAVGPIEVRGRMASVEIAAVGRRKNVFVRWTNRVAIREADCVVGPRGLPFTTVRFLIGRDRPDAVPVRLPLYYPTHGHASVRWMAGRYPVAVRFSLYHFRTVLSAPATRAVAPVYGLTAYGPNLSDEIAWTVERPVRALKARIPIAIGGLRISDPWSRFEDWGQSHSIRSTDAAAAEKDDILVEARRPSPNGLKLMRVGSNDLSKCVSLMYDLKRQQTTLVC